MSLEPKLKDALEKINFISRFKELSQKYSFDLKQSFERYDYNECINIIKGFGYTSTFDRRENFFKIIEETPFYKFQFNIVLKYGATEFIWAIWKDKELVGGNNWGVLKTQLDGNHDDKVRLPIFRNYIDLEEILAEAFAIYEDFKREFLANQ